MGCNPRHSFSFSFFFPFNFSFTPGMLATCLSARIRNFFFPRLVLEGVRTGWKFGAAKTGPAAVVPTALYYV